MELTAGRWVHRLSRRYSDDFLHLRGEVAAIFPATPKIVVI
ncbi:hypothetical protein [Streptosporangium saharense]|uniref:Uncharacterized protein n=1 Tax=Streptosporangium saharense TaxID=1706840 RepID=A0A7W7QTD4_9ACTN|nr:hypothetical protein [Streptosporangium saharense]MBB4919118.1 hypothetical protein [Streptosporangium saharense]